MTDASMKKRAWFQLHLSTCVVLMFVAGAIVWSNVKPQRTSGSEMYAHYDKGVILNVRNPWDGAKFGWPWIYQEKLYASKDEPSAPMSDPSMGNLKYISPGGEIYYKDLAKNLLVGIFLLVLSGIICERTLRRREGNRAVPKKRPWFQLSLSTCMALMCIAGALMCANMGEPRIISEKVFDYRPSKPTDIAPLVDVNAQGPGWPVPLWSGKAVHRSREEAVALLKESAAPKQAAIIGINISVAVIILAGVAFASESLLRRRERKRAA